MSWNYCRIHAARLTEAFVFYLVIRNIYSTLPIDSSMCYRIGCNPVYFGTVCIKTSWFYFILGVLDPLGIPSYIFFLKRLFPCGLIFLRFCLFCDLEEFEMRRNVILRNLVVFCWFFWILDFFAAVQSNYYSTFCVLFKGIIQYLRRGNVENKIPANTNIYLSHLNARSSRCTNCAEKTGIDSCLVAWKLSKHE